VALGVEHVELVGLSFDQIEAVEVDAPLLATVLAAQVERPNARFGRKERAVFAPVLVFAGPGATSLRLAHDFGVEPRGFLRPP